MRLFLHTPDGNGNFFQHYQQAFRKAVELFIVTAYLTDWDKSLNLNSNCSRFRFIIGKDFGITRKAACEKVLRWLPASQKDRFMVADQIDGFHPKAVFWKESEGQCYAIIGSSNLTRAAFESNYEANMYGIISPESYTEAKRWIKRIEKQSVPVSKDWLDQYTESIANTGQKSAKQIAVASLDLPNPRGMASAIFDRRKKLAAYLKVKADIGKIFRQCANGKLKSEEFYEEIKKYWNGATRFQGSGWERKGMSSDFRALSKSFVAIVDAPDEDRDDIVVREIDSLCRQGVPTRKAFLSEMLCLRFPSEYPVLNAPVQEYLRAIKFRPPYGASEGSRYVDLARKLRVSLLQNPQHPAKNLAELDTIIWLAYGE